MAPSEAKSVKSIEKVNAVQQLIKDFHLELEKVKIEMEEIALLIRQSGSEVENLAKNNVQITNKLRIMESQLDIVPRTDLKETYNAAQQSQLRLFTMRGQVEQLQSKQQFLKRYADTLQRLLETVDDYSPASMEKGKSDKAITPSVSSIVNIINAQENERQFLARQMHDGPAQSLTNLILQAEICEKVFDDDPVRARNELANLKQAITQTFTRIREFIFNLRPMMLDDLGLVPTLKRYLEDFEEKTRIASNLEVINMDQRLPSPLEVALFRIIQNLLNNIRAHGQSTQVNISFDVGANVVLVTLEDNGGAFRTSELPGSEQERRKSGIVMAKEQVEMLGGQIEFERIPGLGTRVMLSLPNIIDQVN